VSHTTFLVIKLFDGSTDTYIKQVFS